MIIVTGANGFIGSCLLTELKERGAREFLVVDTVSPKDRTGPLGHHSDISFIATEPFLTALQRDEVRNVEAIFHMGACSSTTETDIEFLRQNNTEYSARLFEYCCRQDVPFIYASSAATYGDGSNGFDDATSFEQLQPLNPYGWSKLNFDVWAKAQKRAPSRWAGLRFFNVFGPNEYHKQEMASVVYKAFLQIQETGRLKLFRSHRSDYKDGMQMRDFVYVKDVTRWMGEIWQANRFENGVYNMGFGRARTWVDLASAVFQNLNREVEIEWMDMPMSIRNQYQYFTEARMERLFAQGISRPLFSLEEGVKDYVQNYLLKSDRYL